MPCGIVAGLLALTALALGQPPAEPKGDPSVIATTREGSRHDSVIPAVGKRIGLPDDGLPLIAFPEAEVSSTARVPLPAKHEKREPVEAEDRGPSALSVEIQGPARVTPGQPFTCLLIARNLGRDALGGVRVALPLPAGVKVVACEPAAEQGGEMLRWSVGKLSAGAERRFRIDLSADQPVGRHHGDSLDLPLVPRIGYAAALIHQGGPMPYIQRELKPAPTVTTPSAPTPSAPVLALAVTGARSATTGDRVILGIRMHNQGQAEMPAMRIRCKLPAGLKHEVGDLLEADVPAGLAAGQHQTVELHLQAASAGTWTVEATVTPDRQLPVTAQHAVTINQSEVKANTVSHTEPAKATLRVDGPRQGTPGGELTYRIEVSNPGKSAVPNTKLRVMLPDGVLYLNAAPATTRVPNSGEIVWELGEMPGEQKTDVTLQVRAQHAGEWALPFTLSGQGMTEVSASHAVRIADTPALMLDATVDAKIIDAGQESACEIRVTNRGATPARGVVVTVKLPDHLTSTMTDGPTKPAQQTPLVFEAVEQLNPRATAVYRLRLRGVKAGAGRVQIEVTAAGLSLPVQQDVASQVRGGGF